MLKRPVNVGFSGGEKKRNEMVQMGVVNPKFAILDETDSGLDIDALRIVGDGINRIMRAPDKAVLLITHYQRLLDYVRPDVVHVLADGRIVRTGGAELAHELEREGYAGVTA
ncbi:MAG: Fe-S cluster assembly ATPase SufC, partial [Sphingomonas sp.]